MMGLNSSSFTFFLCLFGFSAFFLIMIIASAIRIVPENICLAVFRFGRYIGERGPGIVILMPFGIDRAIRIDVNDQVQRAQAQQQMWGVIGETQTPVYTDGQVEVSGQVWNAVSQTPIPAGVKIRVVKVLLEVETLTT
jgi:membrane-bound ClpP family serine protease